MAIPTRFTRAFGCRHPLQQAGMGGASLAGLAIAVSAGGAMGMLTGTIGRDALAADLDAVPVDATIGVNFLTPFLDRSAVEEAAARGPLVEFFWGEAPPGPVEIVHGGGARAGWQIGSPRP